MYNDSLFNAFARSFEAEVRPICRWRNIWSCVEAIRCDTPTQPNDYWLRSVNLR